jgi:anaerobic magnesium-protoporphyrin IX monomethyl ester cyclase
MGMLPFMKVLLTTLHSKYIHASLALPYLQAYCSDLADFEIREYTVNEPKEAVLARIVGSRSDVICFSVYIWNRLATLELVACLKLINPQLKIVLGGPELSFEERAFFEQHPVDALIRGEGERPLRRLLSAWRDGSPITGIKGVQTAFEDPLENDLLKDLDEIPSPFANGLVDLKRGLVYYESSRGCPYSCSFCMSALDQRVRSFSFERTKADLRILIESEVPLIKFVDRTFNYDPQRAREIFSFLLEKNRSSRFHFEIGAHLLDAQTLALLAEVPNDLFQFEIGVQSTLPETLERVHRKATFAALKESVEQLQRIGNIHVHLDLIAGLPGEGIGHILKSLNDVVALKPDHLQIEPVKLLPGAPLRREAKDWGIVFDPQPPYTALSTSTMNYADLEQLRGIGRLLDLYLNSGRFKHLLPELFAHFGSPAFCFIDLHDYWQRRELFSLGHSSKDVFMLTDDYLCGLETERLPRLRELLGRDFANHERVVAGSCPDFFNTDLTLGEEQLVRERVKQEVANMPRQGKVQYFAAAFDHLPDVAGRVVLLFLYHQQAGGGRSVREVVIPLNES